MLVVGHVQLLAEVSEYLPLKIFMNISRIFYKTLWNFNGAITRHDCHDYVGRIWNDIENVQYNNYKIFTANICMYLNYTQSGW